MVLLASSTLAVAMNVAVQVLPPSAVCKLLNVPFSTVTSRKSKPVTISLKLKVTTAVSPNFSAWSLMLSTTLGATLSIAQLMKLPVPTLPAKSVQEPSLTLMVLLASSTLAVAMNVAVQVFPPSAVCKLLNVPFSTVTSRKSKPVTISLKLKVTTAVSPNFSAWSLILRITLGATLSIAQLMKLPVPTLPAKSVQEPSLTLMVLLASCTLAAAVKVAVQVLPPSAVCKLLNVPFSTVTSRKSKPVIISLKLKVTTAVSPNFSAWSLILRITLGAVVSTVLTEISKAAYEASPSASFKP